MCWCMIVSLHEVEVENSSDEPIGERLLIEIHLGSIAVQNEDTVGSTIIAHLYVERVRSIPAS